MTAPDKSASIRGVRQFWRIPAAVGVGAVILLAACRGGGVETTANVPTTVPTSERASGEVRNASYRFKDGRRASRLVEAEVHYPDGSGALPLVIVAHGLGGSGPRYSELSRSIAAAGFVVAAPTFPVSSSPMDLGAVSEEAGNQTADLTFVIDQLLRLNRTVSAVLHRRIDPGRIAIAGHSMGAQTVLLSGFHPCCHDARVRAAVVIAGYLSGGVGPYAAAAGLPVLFVHGDRDEIIPLAAGRAAYAALSAPKHFVTVLDGDHRLGIFSGEERLGALTAVVVDFLAAELKGDAAARDRLQHDGNLPGLTRFESAH